MSIKNKKIFAVHRYYYPDSSPYGRILFQMVEKWRRDQNVVDVLTGMPTYLPEEEIKKITLSKIEQTDYGRVERLKLYREKGRPAVLRILNAIRLIFGVFKRLLISKRYDYVICSTTPPVILAFTIAAISKVRGFKFIYHYMDIHPEIGITAGHYKNRLVFFILRWMDIYAARSAYACVVLSEDMKRSLLERDSRLSPFKVEVINNFGVSSRDLSVVNEVIHYDSNFLNILYAGNIGKFQSLDILVEAARLLKSVDTIRIHIIGTGTEAESLENRAIEHGLNNIKFYGQLASDEAQAAIAGADLAYLSVSSSVLKFAFPSKLGSYLAEGTPVLAMADENSELSKQLILSKAGLVVKHDPKALADVLISLSNNRLLIEDMKLNLYKSGDAVFSKETYFSKWEVLLSRS